MTKPNAAFPEGLRTIRDWCVTHDFHPNRLLGQNFLADGNMRRRILDTIDPRPGLRIIEIGPGLGALTRPMLDRGAAVTAIEKDTRLAKALEGWLGDAYPGLRLITDDALTLPLAPLLDPPVDLLVSNLPYSVGTRILMRWMPHPAAPRRLVVTVQAEVAERLAASPGSRTRGLASVWAQRFYDVEVLRRLTPGCFWPQPTVDSALVRLTRHAADTLTPGEGAMFEWMTRHAFMHRRKQMLAIWRRAPAPHGADDDTLRTRFARAEVAPEDRPEMLELHQWRQLARIWTQERGTSG